MTSSSLGPNCPQYESYTPVDFLDIMSSMLAESNVAVSAALSCLFGAVSILAAMATLLLVRRGVAQRSVQILLGATVALYISTCVYFGYTQSLLSIQSKLISNAIIYLDPSYSSTCSYGESVNQWFDISTAQTGALAGTLAVNMIISDMVVWWRAIVIWSRNKIVLGAGIILLVTTGALGITMVTTSQSLSQVDSTIPSSATDALGSIPMAMAYDPIGLACAVLSLATNVIATALIGYKAWIHRHTMRKYQARGKVTQSHALNVMMIIVESGVGYCLLWIVCASYFGFTLNPWDVQTDTDEKYIANMDDFVLGCLVPLVAMYPMVIIVIVAMNQSPIDSLYASLHSKRSGHV